MILHIGDNGTEGYDVPYSWLCDKAVHLFLTSQKWEKLVVNLSESIPLNCMKYLVMKCSAIEVVLPDRKLTDKELAVLCEIYEDKAGALRKANMLGRDLHQLISIDS